MEIKANPNYTLTKEEKGLLQEGDVILRRGEGFTSSVINNLAKADYQLSHCAFLVKDSIGNWQVIHTVSSTLSATDGVQAEPLDRFLRESVENTIVVLRLKADSTQRMQIAERAKYYLTQHIGFDDAFDLKDTTEYYCTELVHHVFMDVFKKDMFEERFLTEHPDYLHFDVFLDRKKFDLILNHQGESIEGFFKP